MSGYDSTKGYNYRFTKKQEGIVEKSAEIGTGNTQDPRAEQPKIGPIEKLNLVKKGNKNTDDGSVYVLGSNRG